ncbi:unnamed protein product [Polarella glacialis]|uniref:Uncharacterized protein n=1 Tax=Polarella glacialis TaxID=89957 RepID=A0A813I7Y4_POLGL|nr:unnamed protein product [Polarella glacialis]
MFCGGREAVHFLSPNLSLEAKLMQQHVCIFRKNSWNNGPCLAQNLNGSVRSQVRSQATVHFDRLMTVVGHRGAGEPTTQQLACHRHTWEGLPWWFKWECAAAHTGFSFFGKDSYRRSIVLQFEPWLSATSNEGRPNSKSQGLSQVIDVQLPRALPTSCT